jgi:hypothetical protein
MNIPTIEELDRIAAKAAGLPVGSTDKWFQKYAAAIRDAVVAACRPQLRPIAEMPAEVPEGCVRIVGFHSISAGWTFSQEPMTKDTHYIDIALPAEAYQADFEQAFAESKLDAKDKEAAFKLWRGGAQ